MPTAIVASASTVPESGVLELRGIVGGYGDVEVLHGVDLVLEAGSVTALLGANGAGKSTLCAIAGGTVSATAGVIRLAGQEITGVPSFRRARDGVLLVPEARGIFPGLTVDENLELMLGTHEQRERAFDRFPILRDRRHHAAGLMSGGEQQMLSLVPALVHPPAVLIADEPTLGLAPLLADLVMGAIREIASMGSAVLLVEEHAQNAFGVADVIALMDLGRMVWIGPKGDADLDLVGGAYLGVTPELAASGSESG
jgi:ABC-type branched-subunit amino acid transport system ATPase component